MDEKIITDLATQVKGVATDVEALKAAKMVNPDELAKARSDMEALAERHKATAAQLDAVARDVAEFRKMAQNEYGKSGAVDYSVEFGKFIQAAYHTKINKDKPLPDHLKAVADYVTTTDAQGGIFVPTLLDPMVRRIIEIHGRMWPYTRKIIVPAGQLIEVPFDSTLPTMTWRASQGTALTEDAGPIAVGDDDLRPVLLADYVAIANELLGSAVINIGEFFATRMISKGIRAIEKGFLLGNTTTTGPHNGVITLADAGSSGSPFEGTALATPTFALMAGFIAECNASFEGSGDTSAYQLVTTQAVANKLAAQAVGASELTGMLVWGSPRDGIPSRLMGYDLVISPHCVSTTNRVVMINLSNVVVAWTGGFAVDFNPYGYASATAGGWGSNETLMKVQTHADYGLGNLTQIGEAVVTALA
ncbi:MAG TPA: phage major capsid protein [Candidatus Krumholzibacteria bacterium]|nr:phage major capsid protein [Candidatus Krumholzibacteria bacterium]HPD73522.1 phage major capsid protein [Candidatus Krumholzibacteria bacterium]HRY42244.1 phage major capsid protein [Candidatus Krumholzibacteria bacterium]